MPMLIRSQKSQKRHGKEQDTCRQMNCDENGLKAGSDHQHTKYYLHRYDYCCNDCNFSRWFEFLEGVCRSGKNEASCYHHHHPMVVFEEILLRRQGEAVWTERPFSTGEPLV